MSNFATISSLELYQGMELTQAWLELFIERTSVHKTGNQWTGDFVKFIHTPDHIENPNHLVQAPNGTEIYVGEHYVGNLIAIKHNNAWYVTRASIIGEAHAIHN